MNVPDMGREPEQKKKSGKNSGRKELSPAEAKKHKRKAAASHDAQPDMAFPQNRAKGEKIFFQKKNLVPLTGWVQIPEANPVKGTEVEKAVTRRSGDPDPYVTLCKIQKV